MEPQLTDFISRNRAAFNTAEPPAHLWEQIVLALPAEDALSKFVQENKSALDVAPVPPSIWKNIEKTLPKNNVAFSFSLWRVAAAVLILIGSGVVLGINVQKMNATTPQLAISKYAPEYAQAEKVFAQKASAMTVALQQYPNTERLIKDMEAYDKALLELQSTIEKSPLSGRPELVRRLIEQYQLKIEILSQALVQYEQRSDLQSPFKENRNESL